MAAVGEVERERGQEDRNHESRYPDRFHPAAGDGAPQTEEREEWGSGASGPVEQRGDEGPETGAGRRGSTFAERHSLIHASSSSWVLNARPEARDTW